MSSLREGAGGPEKSLYKLTGCQQNDRMIGHTAGEKFRSPQKGTWQTGSNQVGDMASVEELRVVFGHNPLNHVERHAGNQHWNFERVGDDILVLIIDGQWRIFTLALYWSHEDECLRFTCSYDLEVVEGRELELLRVVNCLNGSSYAGIYCLHESEGRVSYRTAMTDQASTTDFLGAINEIVEWCDQCYPAFQMVNIGQSDADEAVGIATLEVAGHA